MIMKQSVILFIYKFEIYSGGRTITTGNYQNPPLVEAIVELRWKLQNVVPGKAAFAVDPGYDVFIGSFYQKIKDSYPSWNKLPQAFAPIEITPHSVHHRFSKKDQRWPLVQVGPGIVTINTGHTESHPYEWKNFLREIESIFPHIQDAYPDPDNLHLESILIRFINAIDFDYENENTFNYLNSKLKTSITFPTELFDEKLTQDTHSFNFSFNLKNIEPPGDLIISMATGQRGEINSIIWEINFVAGSEILKIDKFPNKDYFISWVDAAHNRIDKAFKVFLSQELERSFQ